MAHKLRDIVDKGILASTVMDVELLCVMVWMWGGVRHVRV